MIYYLDNAATTRPSKQILETIAASMSFDWANPSSISDHGKSVKRKIEEARQSVAEFIGADASEIYFTSSGSEANTWAIRGYESRHYDMMTLLTSTVEHSSIRNLSQYMLNKNLIKVRYAPVNENGAVDLMMFEAMMNQIRKDDPEDTPLVSIMFANNETGVVNDIKQIAKYVHKNHGVLHTDATQAVSHISISVHDMGIDLMTFSGHKLGLPRGIGVLYVRHGIKIDPLIFGGSQENGLRGGTENQALIIALGKVCRNLKSKLRANIEAEAAMRKLFESLLVQILGDDVSFHGRRVSTEAPSHRLPNISSVCFKGIDAQALMTLLNEYGIYCSAGSACEAYKKTPSQVLLAMNVSEEDALSTLRFSFSHDNIFQSQDILKIVQIIVKCVESLKIVTTAD